MMTMGWSGTGLQRLRDMLAAQVAQGRVPGLVLAVSRGDDVWAEAAGTASAGGGAPMRTDALFRITSMTRPVTALAALQLVERGLLDLDEPVDRLLPELTGRRVLRRLDGPVQDTVPAERPVTVRDLLTFRAGFGMILGSPEQYPILAAEQALELSAAGPPVPVTPHAPDEWLRRLGTLPLMDQPGRQWRYCTSSLILGVLIARAAGQPAEACYQENIFGPLGMTDTGFRVPAAQLGRLVPCFQHGGDGLEEVGDQGAWSRPRAFTDCGAGLVSTAADYLTFGRMLLAGGTVAGRRILAPELVAAMTADQLTPEQRAGADMILGGQGWGYGLSVIDPPPGARGPKGYGWSGGFGTFWFSDPAEDLVAVLCTQVFFSEASAAMEADVWPAVYRALDG
jgi:CubicO group peptidase (beta-lactamase class C family)